MINAPRTYGLAYFTPSGSWRIDRFVSETTAIDTLRRHHGFTFNPAAPDLYKLRDRLRLMAMYRGVELSDPVPRTPKGI